MHAVLQPVTLRLCWHACMQMPTVVVTDQALLIDTQCHVLDAIYRELILNHNICAALLLMHMLFSHVSI